jgi:hypothetical protein
VSFVDAFVYNFFAWASPSFEAEILRSEMAVFQPVSSES